jgi:homoserine kinase type II
MNGDADIDPRAILQRWDLGPVAHVTELLGGAVNRVFRASTPSGRVYLRVYRKSDRDTVAREHALLGHASAAGLPVLVPIASALGGTVVMFEGAPCALYPEAQGAQVAKADLTLEHAAAAGETLGRVHACLAGAPAGQYRRYTLRWPRQAWIDRIGGIARAVRERGEHADDARVLQRIADQCAWLADARCVHEYDPSFAPQLIHGDFQHANLFFAQGSVSAILDWEQAAYMPRAFEVVRAAAYMFDLAPEPTRELVRSYRSVTQIGDDELDDGARAWGCMSDHYVWALEEVYLHGNDRARQYIPLQFRPFHRAWEAARP